MKSLVLTISPADFLIFTRSDTGNVEMYVTRKGNFLCRFKDETFKTDNGKSLSQEDVEHFLKCRHNLICAMAQINNIWSY